MLIMVNSLRDIFKYIFKLVNMNIIIIPVENIWRDFKNLILAVLTINKSNLKWRNRGDFFVQKLQNRRFNVLKNYHPMNCWYSNLHGS